MSWIGGTLLVGLALMSSANAVASADQNPAQVIIPGQNDVEFRAAVGNADLWCRDVVLAIVTAHGIGVDFLVPSDFAAPETAQIRPVGASAIRASPELFENLGGGLYRVGLEPVDGRWATGEYQVGLRLVSGDGFTGTWVLLAIVMAEIPSCFVQWRTEDGGNAHWYAVIDQPMLRDQAKPKAERVGGHLATITAAAEKESIDTNLSLIASREVILGGRQDPVGAEPAGGWRWVAGEPCGFTNWACGEPNDVGGDEGCLSTQSFGYDEYLWNDYPCSGSGVHID